MTETDQMINQLANHRMKSLAKTNVVRNGLVCRPNGKYPYASKVYGVEELKALLSEAYNFWLTEGPQVTLFENEVAKRFDSAKCVATNSGSSANLLALAATMQPDAGPLKPVGVGDTLVTTALGFPTTVAPAIQLGLKVLVVDVDPLTWNVDTFQLERAMNMTNARVVMLAHTLGNPMDMSRLMHILEDREVWFIEDTCDAFGSSYDRLDCGTFGHLATLSFYPPHHITTGEGGMVICNAEQMEPIVRSLRDWGRECVCRAGENNRCGDRFGGQHGMLPVGYDHKFVYSRPGYNMRTTDLQAAVGREQLKRLDAFSEARAYNWGYLRGKLDGLVNSHKISVVRADCDSVASWFGFGMVVNSMPRVEVVTELARRNIDTRHPFAGDIRCQPGFVNKVEGFGTLHKSRSATDNICKNGFFLGVYPGLSRVDLDYIASQVVDVIG
jgi:CDP-6-deoxy-D-xylo-4-hexulose-3-dehydrase